MTEDRTPYDTPETTMPLPPGFDSLGAIKPPVMFYADEDAGITVLFDPTRKIGCLWHAGKRLWTCWRPIESVTFAELVNKILAQEAVSEATAEALQRITRH
jgi:hypothetical protein